MKALSLIWMLAVELSLARIAVAADAVAAPNAPAVLPGKGLTQHDFFYAGEAKQERMFIVRNGAVVWSYTHPGKGEISDATLLPSGNILFAHQFGLTEINPEKKVIWNLDGPTNTEIHTAQLFGTNSVWYIQNGDPAKFIIINWFNQWSGEVDPANPPVQAIEVTPNKEIVWALRSWKPPADLGPATTIQVLQ